MKNIINQKNVIGFAIFTSFFMAIFFSATNRVQAYTAAEINQRVPNAATTMVLLEYGCTDRLVQSINQGGAPRTIVNRSQPYTGPTWASARNQPTVTQPSVSYGQTAPIDMQLNAMTFLCAILVNDNRGLVDSSPYMVTPSTYPNERRPNTSGDSAVSLLANKIGVLGVSVDDGGFGGHIVLGNNQTAIWGNPNSRYWFTPDGGLPFSYVPNSPITSPRTVTVKFIVSKIYIYSGNVHQCAGGTPGTSGTISDYGPCDRGTVSISFSVTPPAPTNNPPVFDANVNCERIHIFRAEDADFAGGVHWIVYYDGAQIASGSGTSNGVISIANRKDASAHNILIRYYDKAPDGSNIREYTRNLTVGPCARPECQPITSVTADVAEPFSINVGFNYSGNGSLGNYSIRLRSYSYTPTGGRVNGISFPSPSISNTNPATFNGLTATTEGRIVFVWEIDFPGTANDLTCTNDGNPAGNGGNPIPVYKSSFFKVYGNDVISGGEFSDGTPGQVCSAQKDIKAFATGSGNDWRGSSVQFAASATGTITGFFSGGMNNSGNSSAAPIGLTHGNYNGSKISPVLSNMGGNSLLGSGCIPDYYALFESLNESQGVYHASIDAHGNLVLPAIDFNVHKAPIILVDGNVTANFSTFNYSINSVDDLLVPYLIARGNIYIDSNATDIMGVYVAVPKAGVADSGKIVTCSSGSNTFALLDFCKNKLVINGAFIAREVIFNRYTDSTVSQDGVNEGPDTTGAAEVFNFSPEIYLNPPDALSGSVSAGAAGSGFIEGYDFLIGLPPVN